MEGGSAGWHPCRQPPTGPRRVAEEGALLPVAGAATLRTGATPGGGRRRPTRPRGVRRAWRRRRRAAAAASRVGAAEVRWRRRGRVGRAGEGERALRERKRRKGGERERGGADGRGRWRRTLVVEAFTRMALRKFLITHDPLKK